MTQQMHGTQISVQIVAHRCNGCGIPYGLPDGFIADRRRDHQSWTCPNGCVRLFNKDPNEVENLKGQIQQLQTSLTHSGDQLEAAVREAESTKGALLRDRHRFANGVCPCCNRSFGNVARHMQSQHPDYDVTKVRQSAVPNFECSCGRDFRSLGGLHLHQSKSRTTGWHKRDARPWAAHLTVV